MKEFENIGREILNWSYTKGIFLNVVSVPYNKLEIFIDIIANYVSQNKKVLYVTEDEKNSYYNKKFKELGIKDYSYAKDSYSMANTAIEICSLSTFENVQKKFDLVIIDDIAKYSDISFEDLGNMVLRKYSKGTKYIVYSIDCIFEEEKEIILPIRSDMLPIIEPRIINTRIDLNKEVPYMVYDYISYSIDLARNLVIFVPDSEKVSNVYHYISLLFKRKDIDISYFIKGKTEEKIFVNYFKKKKSVVMITDDFDKENIISKDTDIMVLFCDDLFFNYKKLMFLCGKVGRNGHGIGEAVFISNNTTYDMEKTCEKARYFNRYAWEMGFLKY